MKRNDQFVIEKIENSIYLLPVGQLIADLNKGIKINETCEFVWNQLAEAISFEELIEKCIVRFAPQEEEKELLKQDIGNLIQSLKARGMIKGSGNIFRCGCSLCRNGSQVLSPMYTEAGTTVHGVNDGTVGNGAGETAGRYMIGGLPVELYGDDAYFYESFEKFKIENEMTEKALSQVMHILVTNVDKMRVDSDKAAEYYDSESQNETTIDLYQNAFTGDYDKAADDYNERTVLIHHNELTVLEYPKEYVLFFHELKGIEELHLSKEGRYAHFYCEEPSDGVRFNLFHAIRMAFLVFALQHGKVMLHSCSVLFKDMVWAFSGPSGTGKSTHCEIWKKLFDTPVVNGDLNLIGIEDGVAYVYGTPWCGSSKIFENAKRRLGGIVLLKQAVDNKLEELSLEKKILYVQQRLITSVWDRTMLEKTLTIVSEIVKDIYVKRFYCNKDDEAGQLIHEDILLSL